MAEVIELCKNQEANQDKINQITDKLGSFEPKGPVNPRASKVRRSQKISGVTGNKQDLPSNFKTCSKVSTMKEDCKVMKGSGPNKHETSVSTLGQIKVFKTCQTSNSKKENLSETMKKRKLRENLSKWTYVTESDKSSKVRKQYLKMIQEACLINNLNDDSMQPAYPVKLQVPSDLSDTIRRKYNVQTDKDGISYCEVLALDDTGAQSELVCQLFFNEVFGDREDYISSEDGCSLRGITGKSFRSKRLKRINPDLGKLTFFACSLFQLQR